MKREEMAMEKVFEAINGVFSFIGPLSDFLWEFPTNFDWYSSIPILGNISFAIILLLGSGIFFSFRIGFMQVTYFKKGIRTMTEKRVVETGISPLASFFLSSAMRVGPGNILGVTGAIAVGGPGALFWMWISAFFGMAVAYMEGVLAQIFKEKKDDEFVGGLPFYGRKLLGNKVWIGVFLSVLYILYALCCLPAQGFNVVSSVGRMAEIVTGKNHSKRISLLLYSRYVDRNPHSSYRIWRNQKSIQMDRYDGAGDGGALYGSSVTSYHIEFYPYSVFLRKCVCRSL